jgi:hypothetical protein
MLQYDIPKCILSTAEVKTRICEQKNLHKDGTRHDIQNFLNTSPVS